MAAVAGQPKGRTPPVAVPAVVPRGPKVTFVSTYKAELSRVGPMFSNLKQCRNDVAKYDLSDSTIKLLEENEDAAKRLRYQFSQELAAKKKPSVLSRLSTNARDTISISRVSSCYGARESVRDPERYRHSRRGRQRQRPRPCMTLT